MRRDPYNDPIMATAMVLSMLHAAKNYKPKPPTAEQIAAADKRTERQKWNDAVEQRKSERKATKAKP